MEGGTLQPVGAAVEERTGAGRAVAAPVRLYPSRLRPVSRRRWLAAGVAAALVHVTALGLFVALPHHVTQDEAATPAQVVILQTAPEPAAAPAAASEPPPAEVPAAPEAPPAAEPPPPAMAEPPVEAPSVEPVPPPVEQQLEPVPPPVEPPPPAVEPPPAEIPPPPVQPEAPPPALETPPPPPPQSTPPPPQPTPAPPPPPPRSPSPPPARTRPVPVARVPAPATPPPVEHPASPGSQTPSASAPVREQAPSPAELGAYRDRLAEHLKAYQHYPALARARREEGLVVVDVTIRRNGEIVSMSVARGSGSRSLDDEAMATLKRADPLPAMPPDVSGTTMALVFPLRFHLQ